MPAERVVVVSPHLDDAALSLGAAIARAARRGTPVTVLTPLAGDPDSAEPDPWALTCGFATAGEAARARREEDRRACAILGAEPVWLPFGRDTPDDVLRAALLERLEAATTVLTPGHPCSHPSHARVSRVVRAAGLPARIGLYADQPYAMWQQLGRPPETGTRARNAAALLARRAPPAPGAGWTTLPRTRRDWLAKQRAIRAYRSQMRAFGPLTQPGIALQEWAWGGERVACIETPCEATVAVA